MKVSFRLTFAVIVFIASANYASPQEETAFDLVKAKKEIEAATA